MPASMNGLLVVMGVMAPLLLLGAATNPQLIGLWTILYIAIGAIAGLGVLVFERSKKGKADDFAKSVETNAASAGGLKDPQKIAQMDHMRKEFQRGIDIYKNHGKDLYSLPWYVVVGESESGKTEMLRRSEIGFPDKLQDRWQGSGGTLSMHWWFSNKAVILDTAGRLFVSEGAEGGQNQWVNFLQMLKKNRPDCPINGLILVIPSNRLLTHPNPEIEATRMAELDKNAGQIAKQLETLQAELGVRFPVYILITKMDKLNGFREFFGKIDKPEDRYQILGWSNPAPLGDAFDPQSVAEYIHSVADRLKRRMMSELRNVEPEMVAGLRIDEVDGLYAFPSAFESMSGKLTRYLRHVFTTDEWSAKPPFLRGIYFTSALQQGMVLDEALAAAMGVPFERMDSSREDDGLSLSKNRTYFVRDLFLDKIFNEKGLVTAAGKIRSRISGWKLWFPALILLMLAGFAALGWWAMSKNDEAKKWTALWTSDIGSAKRRIAPLATFEYGEFRPAKAADATKLLVPLEALGQDVKGRPNFGWIFAPAQWFDHELAKKRPHLYADLVAETLGDLEQAVIGKLTADAAQSPTAATTWSDGEWQALHALVILQSATRWDAEKKSLALKDAPETAWPTSKLLEALFLYAGIRNERKSAPAFESTFEQCLWYAHTLPDSTFKQRLADRRGDKLQSLLHQVLPPDQLEQQKKSVTDINEFHRTLMLAKGYDATTVDNLAQAAVKLNPAITPPKAAGTADTKHLASDRDTLLAVILDHASLARDYGYADITKGDDLTAGAKALRAKDGAMLKRVTDTLELIKSNPSVSLNANTIDAFTAASPPADTQPDDDTDAASLKKESQQVIQKLSELKKEWFKTAFFPRHFAGYLKLPVASDAQVGSNEELVTLWKLCGLAEKWDVETPKVRQLIATFNCFFDTSKITASDVMGTLRPCQLNFVKVQGQSVAGYSITTNATKIAEFNTMQESINPIPFHLDQPLTFHQEHAADVTVPAWGLLKEIKLGQQNPWRYTTPAGACYDVSIQGTNLDSLRQWPKTGDFKH